MISNYKFRKKFSSKSPLLNHSGPKTSYNFYDANSLISRVSSLSSKRKGLSLKQSQVPPSVVLNQSKNSQFSSNPKPIKATMRPSSYRSNRIFDSSVYLTDPISQGPFEFEVKLLSSNSGQGERYSSVGSSIEGIYSTFHTATYDNEKWSKAQKSPLAKRIDLEKFRETQNMAAIIIQNCWRDFKSRKIRKEKVELTRAEAKARRAIHEYEELKLQMMKFRKQQVQS